MPGFLSDNLLSALIGMPALGAVLLMFFKRPADVDDHNHNHAHDESQAEVVPAGASAIRWFTLFWSALVFVLSLVLLTKFNPQAKGFQLVEGPTAWIATYRVNYHVGVDGFSLLLILLTTFLTLLCSAYSFNVKKRIKEYMIFLLILETAMLVVFSA